VPGAQKKWPAHCGPWKLLDGWPALFTLRENVPFALDLRAKQLDHDREEITVYAGPAETSRGG